MDAGERRESLTLASTSPLLLPLIAPAAGPNGKSVLYSLNNSDI